MTSMDNMATAGLYSGMMSSDRADAAGALNAYFAPYLSSYTQGKFMGPVTAVNYGQAMEHSMKFIQTAAEKAVLGKQAQWLTTAIMPLGPLEESHMTVIKRRYAPQLHGLVPYEGVARLLTAKFETYTRSTERRGARLKLEGDFVKFAGGAKQELVDRMEQLRQTMSDTIATLVLATLSGARDERRYEMLTSGKLSGETIETILSQDAMHFGAAQKGGFNLATIVATVTDGILASSGVAPDTVILPSEMAHIMNASERVPVLVPRPVYDERGAVTRYDPTDVGIRAPIFKDLAVFFTDTMLPTGDAIDAERRPAFGNRTFTPEHYAMGDSLDGNPHSNWTQRNMDTYIHDERIDDYAKVRFRTAVEHCYRWTATDGSLRAENEPTQGDMLLYNTATVHADERDCGTKYRHDVFHSHDGATNGNWTLARTFGCLCRSHHLPTRLLNDCAETMSNGITGYTASEAEAMTMTLRTLVDESDQNSSLGLSYFTELVRFNAKYYKRQPGARNLTLPAGTIMDIPRMNMTTAGGMAGVPPGISTWPALKSLAQCKGVPDSQWAVAGATADKCIRFVRALTRHARSFAVAGTADHIVATWVPKWQGDLCTDDSDKLACALFNMLIGRNPRAPLFFCIPDTAGTAPAPTGVTAASRPTWAMTEIALLANLLTATEIGQDFATSDLDAEIVRMIMDARRAQILPTVQSLQLAHPNFAISPGDIVGDGPLATAVLRCVQRALLHTKEISATAPEWLVNLTARIAISHGADVTDEQIDRIADELYAASQETPGIPAMVIPRTVFAANRLDPTTFERLATMYGSRGPIDTQRALGLSVRATTEIGNHIWHLLSTATRTTLLTDVPDVDSIAVVYDVLGPPVNVQSYPDDERDFVWRWMRSAWTNVRLAGLRPNRGNVLRYMQGGHDPTGRSKLPLTWVKTVFGVSAGLCTMLIESIGTPGSTVVALPDRATGYETPVVWGVEEILTGMRRPDEVSSLRTGAMVSIGGMAGPMQTGLPAVGTPLGYGVSSLLNEHTGGAVASKRIASLYHATDGELASPLRRALAAVLVMTRIHRKTITAMLDANVMPPLAISLVRPFIEHQTKGLAIMKRGYELGQTFVGQVNADGGWSTRDKTLEVSLTYHVLPFLWGPKLIKVLRNIMTIGHCRNFGTDFCSEADAVAEGAGSCVARLTGFYDVTRTPCAENEGHQLPSLISAVGKFNLPNIGQDDPIRMPHMCCDIVYKKIFTKYYRAACAAMPRHVDDLQTSDKPHMCQLGEQYVAGMGPTFDMVYRGTGPLTEASMPGSAAARMNGSVYPVWVKREGLI